VEAVDEVCHGAAQDVVVIFAAPGVAGDGRIRYIYRFVQFAKTEDGTGGGEEEARILADISSVISEIGQRASET
jgi:hypothetical protein